MQAQLELTVSRSSQGSLDLVTTLLDAAQVPTSMTRFSLEQVAAITKLLKSRSLTNGLAGLAITPLEASVSWYSSETL